MLIATYIHSVILDPKVMSFIDPNDPMFEDVDQETLDNEFKDEEVADLPEQKEVNTVEENNMIDKDQIDLFKNIGVTKIKGKLGFQNEHNKEQAKTWNVQGVDIKFLDDEE